MERDQLITLADSYLCEHRALLSPAQDAEYLRLLREEREKPDTGEEGSETPISLDLAKFYKILQLRVYDNSAEVNGFEIGGQVMWINKYDRANLKNSVTDLQDSGAETVKFKGVTLPVAQARAMLSAVEVYAAKCAENTDAHEAAILELGSEDDVEAYDFTTGYPEKVKFTI